MKSGLKISIKISWKKVEGERVVVVGKKGFRVRFRGSI